MYQFVAIGQQWDYLLLFSPFSFQTIFYTKFTFKADLISVQSFGQGYFKSWLLNLLKKLQNYDSLTDIKIKHLKSCKGHLCEVYFETTTELKDDLQIQIRNFHTSFKLVHQSRKLLIGSCTFLTYIETYYEKENRLVVFTLPSRSFLVIFSQLVPCQDIMLTYPKQM